MEGDLTAVASENVGNQQKPLWTTLEPLATTLTLVAYCEHTRSKKFICIIEKNALDAY
jgi:hypothetical protein